MTSNHDDIDQLMEDVLREVANPAPIADFETRIAHRSTAMSLAANPPLPSSILSFGSLNHAAARRTSPQSIGIAVLLNVAALLLLTIQIRGSHILTAPHQSVALVDPVIPPPLPPSLTVSGGGGGNPGAAPVSKGNPPKADAVQLNPPKAPVADALLPAPVTIDSNIKMAHVDLPNFGAPNAPNVGTSLGNGTGTGIGSGNGSGVGPGSGGGMGGGVHRIGGGVSAPQVLFAPEPEFSEEARKAKVSGNVLVYLQVDPNGRPTKIRVLRGIGLGLDQKAVEAVSHYKFKPAMEDGHPVTVEMNVEVNFQIF